MEYNRPSEGILFLKEYRNLEKRKKIQPTRLELLSSRLALHDDVLLTIISRLSVSVSLGEILVFLFGWCRWVERSRFFSLYLSLPLFYSFLGGFGCLVFTCGHTVATTTTIRHTRAHQLLYRPHQATAMSSAPFIYYFLVQTVMRLIHVFYFYSLPNFLYSIENSQKLVTLEYSIPLGGWRNIFETKQGNLKERTSGRPL